MARKERTKQRQEFDAELTSSLPDCSVTSIHATAGHVARAKLVNSFFKVIFRSLKRVLAGGSEVNLCLKPIILGLIFCHTVLITSL